MTLSGHLGRRLEAAVGAVGPSIRFASLGWILADCLTVVPIVRAIRRSADRDDRTGEDGSKPSDPDENGTSGDGAGRDEADTDRTPSTRARALARRLLRASIAG